MRIHLLEHDPWDFSRTNITAWARKRGYAVRSTNVFAHEPLPSPEEFDWLMVMGGSQHAWEEDKNPWLAGEKRFIAEVLARRKILLGICFGAQLLAEALGARVFPNGQKEIGWYEVSLTGEGEASFLFRDVPASFVSFHWHDDHFSLPDGCTRLAASGPTPNQAFVCGGAPVVGVQFHPEYTREMVLDFARTFGEEWTPGPFVAGKEAIQARTEEVPNTYWLMERLLDNMDREFRG